MYSAGWTFPAVDCLCLASSPWPVDAAELQCLDTHAEVCVQEAVRVSIGTLLHTLNKMQFVHRLEYCLDKML